MKRKTSPLYILYVFVICFFLIWVLNNCVSIPSGVDKETDKEIRRVLQIVKQAEYNNVDWFKDNKFDCKDRALCFYINFRGRAEIVSNVKLNHAFIKVYTQNGFVLIEPKTYIQDDYTMRGRWGRDFDGQAYDRTAIFMALYNAWGGR